MKTKPVLVRGLRLRIWTTGGLRSGRVTKWRAGACRCEEDEEAGQAVRAAPATPTEMRARARTLGGLACGPRDRDQENRSRDDGSGSDRERGDTDRVERIPAEQRQA